MEETTKETLIACDLCKRRIAKHYKKEFRKCLVCNKDICGYCSVKITRSYRERFDCGYSQTNKTIGKICIICMETKTGIKLEKLNYPLNR